MSKRQDYLDFELKIEPGSEGGHVIRVTAPGGRCEVRYIQPFSADKQELIRQTIINAALRSAANVRGGNSADVMKMKEVGRALFDSVMPEPVRDLYNKSQGQAEEQGKGLRWRLVLDPKMADLPWEFMTSPQSEFVGLDPRSPLVRFIELPSSPSVLVDTLPLNILVVIASPEDQAPLDVQTEKDRILAALKPLESIGKVRVVIIEGRDTWMRLIEALRPDETHILHFIGHGTFDRMNGEGALVMEGDNGLSELIGSERLKILVRGRKHLRLVVLNSCLGTEASESEPFSSAAAALVRAGVPAVIAMQFEVSDDAAKKFAKTFYESLALNLPVDAALTEARRDIYLLNANTLEWATPVLFMQVPNGQLFDFSQSLPPPPADSLAKAAQPSLKKADGLGEGGIDLNQRAQAFYDKAYDAELQGDWETAIKAYQGALYAVPDFKDASVRWANCTRRQQCRDSYEQARRAYADERYAEALEILARIRTLDPSWVDQADIQVLSDCGLKYRAALEALKLGNKNKGVELLRAIVTTRSTFKDASVRLDNILEGGDGLLGKTTLPPTPQPAKGRPSNPPRADGVLPFDDRVQADVQDTGDKSNELPSSARTYRWSSGNVEELVDHIRNWFVSKNYQVQVIGDANAYVVQGAKKSMVRGLLGTNAAASVTLQFSDDELRLHVGGGKWLDKAGAAATGIWITGGLTLVTGAYGLGVQKILLDDLWRACDVYLQSQGAKRLS